MQIPLLLFFIAFIGIIIMIIRKLYILKTKEIEHTKNIDLEFQIPDLEQVKKFTNKKFRRYGYIMLVSFMKIYIISERYLKNKSIYYFNKIKGKIFKKNNNPEINKIKKESSKFINTIKEYKHKIKRIKHKIKEEEGIK